MHSATRERVLRMVEAQHAPISIGALVAATGLHENTVRGHLERLHADGYVRREREPRTDPGRPAWLWRATHADRDSVYAGLATALATMVARAADPVGDAEEAGRAWGAEIARDTAEPTEPAAGIGPADAQTGRAAVITVMREHGFDPDDTGDVVLLRRCPLIEAATRTPEIVCAVHQGMIDGILSSHDAPGGSELLPFTSPGVCTLRLPSAS
ncbi:helix-turn-helix domain-containing protein [Microbacterium panaciterrae]|uniref:Helix-turn-helix domain-containing protein n=1 Tax=Microbacterium panaciterrae TaxID=985759 RepID=A0ABP8P541_9MICO